MDYLEKCIAACYDCSVACEKCATQCLFEEDSHNMTKCILLDRECSVICTATAKILSIGADHFQLLCEACEEICMACAAECGRHDNMSHCRQCAEACTNCAEMCRKIIESDAL